MDGLAPYGSKSFKLPLLQVQLYPYSTCPMCNNPSFIFSLSLLSASSHNPIHHNLIFSFEWSFYKTSKYWWKIIGSAQACLKHFQCHIISQINYFFYAWYDLFFKFYNIYTKFYHIYEQIVRSYWFSTKITSQIYRKEKFQWINRLIYRKEAMYWNQRVI